MRRWFHLIGHSTGCGAILRPLPVLLPLVLLQVVLLQLLAGLAQGEEFAVLSTGYRLRADRHEVVGNSMRLISVGGVTELPAAMVVGFEEAGPDAEPARTNEPNLPAEAPQLLETIDPVPLAPVTPASLAADAARKFALPEAFVRSVMQVESGFQPGAISAKGAIGLMQLMPGTARDLGVDARDPRQNTEGGTAYLRNLLKRYEGQPDQVLLALAAYNAGPAAVERYRGVPPYPETRQYILRVLRAWGVAGPAAAGGTNEAKLAGK